MMVKNLTKATAVGLIGIGMMLAAQSAVAQKTIAFIANTGSGQFGTHDANIIDALSTVGITVNGVTIPGLGYTVNVYDHNAEPDPVTEDLIFISQTVSSGNVTRYTTGTVPIINTEAALNDDGGTACDMYFSDGQGGRGGETLVTITDNSHEITQPFVQGGVYNMFGSGQMGEMRGTWAGGITMLGVNTVRTGNGFLAVADTGASPLRGGAPPGSDPAPARRVCLGFHDGTFINPTGAGVLILQRTVQWAIGDPVTANFEVARVDAGTRDLPGDLQFGSTLDLGSLTSYVLTVNLDAAGSFATTDTLPAGLTFQGANASAGTVTNAGQDVYWSGSLGAAGAATCEIGVIASAPGSYGFTNGDGSRTGAVQIGGDVVGIVGALRMNRMRARLGMVLDNNLREWPDDNTWNTVPDPLPAGWISQDIERTVFPGSAQYSAADDRFVLRGAGQQWWNLNDQSHFLYQLVEGDFVLEARVKMHPFGSDQETRVGIQARNMDDPDPALSAGIVWAKNNYGVSNAARPNTGDNIQRNNRIEDGARDNMLGDTWFRLERTGSTTTLKVVRYPWTSSTLPVNQEDITDYNPALNPVVALGMFAAASPEQEGRDSVVEAEFTSVVLTGAIYTVPLTVARSFGATNYTPGTSVTVTLDVTHNADVANVTVTENLPAGHGTRVGAISNGGVVNGDTIEWTLTNVTADMALTYDIRPLAQVHNLPIYFLGSSWMDVDKGYMEAFTDTALPAVGTYVVQHGILPDPSYVGTMDAHVTDNAKNNNSGAHEHLEEGDWDGGTNDHKKVLVRFDLPAPTITWDSFWLGLWNFDEQREDARNLHDANLQRILKPWGEGWARNRDGREAFEGEVTFNSTMQGSAQWDIPGLMASTDAGTISATTQMGANWPEWVFWDVGADVTDMLGAPANNHGWKLSQDIVQDVPDDDPTNNAYVRGAYKVRTKEHDVKSERPLLIAYEDANVPQDSIAGLSRSVPTSYTWGIPFDVMLDVLWNANALPIQVVEDLPAGVDPANVNPGAGTIVGNQIVWDIASFTTDTQLQYQITVQEGDLWELANDPVQGHTMQPLILPGATATDDAGRSVSVGQDMIPHAGSILLQDGVWPDNSYAGCQDTFILTFRKDNNAGGSDVMEEGDWRGRQNGNGLDDHKKPLIQFDLSGVTIPPGENYQGARLWLYMIHQRRGDAATSSGMYDPNLSTLEPWEHPGNQDHALFVWPIDKAWNQGRGTGTDGGAALVDEVTWNNANVGADTGTTVSWEIPGAMGTSDVGGAYDDYTWVDMPTTDSQDIGIWVPLNVSVSVGEFLAGTATNNGWKICQDDASGIPDDDPSNVYEMGAYQFVTSENAQANLRPILEIMTDARVPVEVSKFIVW